MKNPVKLLDETGTLVLDVRPGREDGCITIDLLDKEGKKVAHLTHRDAGIKPYVDVMAKKKVVGKVLQRFSLSGERFYFDKINWHAEGDALPHAYDIFDHEKTAAQISRADFKKSAHILLDVRLKKHLLPVICMVLAIDLVILTQTQANGQGRRNA